MSDVFDAIRERLGYMLSLPERSIRSLAATATGITSLLTEALFPEALKGTTLYKIFIGDAQRFVTEKVAQVQREGQAAEPTADMGDDYVQRKVVGGVLETAGLLAMHFSPLWVFAIAGDAAAGTNAFLHRLVEQLKQNGVISEDTEINGLDELLASMQESSKKSVAAIDTPPLSREELSKLAGEMTESYKQMFSKATNLVPRFEDLWKRMQDLANKEETSLERISGILTIDVASWGKKGINTALSVGQTGTDMFGEMLLDSFGRTLNAVGEQGMSNYLVRQMKPFLEAAKGHFDPEKKTLTESILGCGEKGEAETGATEPPSESTETDQPSAES